MAFSDRDWEIVRAYFERGLSMKEIVEREDVKMKNKSSISRRAKAEGWEHGKKQRDLQEEIQAKQALSAIEQQKATMPATELVVHETLVNERLADIKFFSNAHRMAANMAVKKLKQNGTAVTYLELNQASTVIARSQEGVLGKEPTTVINNTNAVQNNAAVLIDRSPEKIRAIKELLDATIGV